MLYVSCPLAPLPLSSSVADNWAMNEFGGKSAWTTQRSVDVVKEGGLFFSPATLIMTVADADYAELVTSLATTMKLYVVDDREPTVIRSSDR